jgi:hypothetical protein
MVDIREPVLVQGDVEIETDVEIERAYADRLAVVQAVAPHDASYWLG